VYGRVSRFRAGITTVLKVDAVYFNNQTVDAFSESSTVMYATARLLVIGALVVSVLICFSAWIGVIVGVSRPISIITGVMRRLAKQDADVDIFGLGRKDEIGAMASAVQVFKENMLRANALASAQASEQAMKEQRSSRVSDLVRGFELTIAKMAEVLSSPPRSCKSPRNRCRPPRYRPISRLRASPQPPKKPAPECKRWRPRPRN
jgi:HAMP domain-containing protein